MSFFPKDIFSVYMIISKTTGSILSVIVLTIYFNFLEICCVILKDFLTAVTHEDI